MLRVNASPFLKTPIEVTWSTDALSNGSTSDQFFTVCPSKLVTLSPALIPAIADGESSPMASQFGLASVGTQDTTSLTVVLRS